MAGPEKKKKNTVRISRSAKIRAVREISHSACSNLYDHMRQKREHSGKKKKYFENVFIFIFILSFLFLLIFV